MTKFLNKTTFKFFFLTLRKYTFKNHSFPYSADRLFESKFGEKPYSFEISEPDDFDSFINSSSDETLEEYKKKVILALEEKGQKYDNTKSLFENVKNENNIKDLLIPIEILDGFLFEDLYQQQLENLGREVYSTDELKNDSERINYTKEFIKGKNGYLREATFNWNDFKCKVDFLKVLENKELEINELKCASDIKIDYFIDMVYQYFIIEKLGYKIRSFNLIIKNRNFVAQKEFNIKNIFRKLDWFLNFEDKKNYFNWNKRNQLNSTIYAKNREIKYRILNISKFKTLISDLSFEKPYEKDFSNRSFVETIKLFLQENKNIINSDFFDKIKKIISKEKYQNLIKINPSDYTEIYEKYFNKTKTPFFHKYLSQNINNYSNLFINFFPITGLENRVIRYNSGYRNFSDFKEKFNFTYDKFGNKKRDELFFNAYENSKKYDKLIINWKHWDKVMLNYANSPLCFFDFEAFGLVNNNFSGIKLNRQIVFQYSIQTHINGVVTKNNFLIKNRNDDFLKNLIKKFHEQVNKNKDFKYIAYYKSYERSRIEDFIDYCTFMLNDGQITLNEYSDYVKTFNRIIRNNKIFLDLADFFNKVSYFYDHREKKYSYSIKRILPYIFKPEVNKNLDYNDNLVTKGDEALYFAKVFFNYDENNPMHTDIAISEEEWTDYFYKPMIKYCELDVEAMVKIYDWIRNLIKNNKVTVNSRMLFLGNTKFSYEILRSFLKYNWKDITVVVSEGDKQNLVEELAIKNNLKIVKTRNINKDIDKLDDTYDFIITVAFGQFLSNEILSKTKNPYNLHASILPKYRGGAPIERAIMNGESVTGITIMKMVKEMDAGPYFLQSKLKILESDDFVSLEKKLIFSSVQLIDFNLTSLILNKIEPIEQNPNDVSFGLNIKKNELMLNFNLPAKAIINHIRALILRKPYFIYKNTRVIVIDYDSNISQSEEKIKPSTIYKYDKSGLYISSSDSKIIRITKIKLENKNIVSISDFFNGNSKFFIKNFLI